MDPITYTIPDAAKILKYNEENILYRGSRGKFSIHVLCDIFDLFYLKLPININEPWEYPDESEVEVPWNEDNRIKSNQKLLSKCCLKRYLAGDLKAKVVLASSEYDENTRIYFGVYNSKGEPLKLKKCKLVVEAKEIWRAKEKLTANKESETLNANQIKVVDATTPDLQDPESSENILPVIEQKVTKVTVYDERKISIENWLKRSGLTFDCRTKKEVFEMIKLAHKDNPLWVLNYDSYEKMFYRRYSKEIGLVGKSGAPPNSKRIKKN